MTALRKYDGRQDNIGRGLGYDLKIRMGDLQLNSQGKYGSSNEEDHGKVG
jgi:hypothetical protein